MPILRCFPNLPVRESIGRFKYVEENKIDDTYEAILSSLKKRYYGTDEKGGRLMPKEYRTIQEVAGPLMLVKDVEGVKYNELAQIELENGEKRNCECLK